MPGTDIAHGAICLSVICGTDSVYEAIRLCDVRTSNYTHVRVPAFLWRRSEKFWSESGPQYISGSPAIGGLHDEGMALQEGSVDALIASLRRLCLPPVVPCLHPMSPKLSLPTVFTE
eukprot:555469-Rhodomonas_salina.2